MLEQIAATFGTRKFAATFARLYPKCENISIDYAVLEPRSAKGEQNSNIFVFLPISDGTISARGPRCTNTTQPKAIRRTAIW